MGMDWEGRGGRVRWMGLGGAGLGGQGGWVEQGVGLDWEAKVSRLGGRPRWVWLVKGWKAGQGGQGLVERQW